MCTPSEYVAFLLAYAAGLREGEILGARWKDLDFEEKTLSIVQTLSHDVKELSAGANCLGTPWPR
nr:tyrosine-type recombinase/integrase [Paenibacillus sp. A3]